MSDTSKISDVEEPNHPCHIHFELSAFLELILTTWNTFQPNTVIHQYQWYNALKKRVRKGIRKGFIMCQEQTGDQYLDTTKLTRVLELISSALKETMNANVVLLFEQQHKVDNLCQDPSQTYLLYTCTITFTNNYAYSIRWSLNPIPPSTSTTSKTDISTVQNDKVIDVIPRSKTKRKSCEMNKHNHDSTVQECVASPLPSLPETTQLLDPMLQTTQLFTGDLDFLEPFSTPHTHSVLEDLLKTTPTPLAPPTPVEPSTSTAHSDENLNLPSAKDLNTDVLYGLKCLNKMRRYTAGIDENLNISKDDIQSATLMLQIMTDMMNNSEKQKNQYKISAAEMIKRYKPNDHAFQACGEYEDKVLIPEIASFVAMTPQTTEMMDTMRVNLAVSLTCVEDMMNWLLCMQKNLNENVISLGDKTGSFLRCNHCLVHCHGFISNELHKQATKQIKKTTAKLEAQKTKPKTKPRKNKKPIKKGRPHKTGLQKRDSLISEPQSTLSDSDSANTDDEEE